MESFWKFFFFETWESGVGVALLMAAIRDRGGKV